MVAAERERPAYITARGRDLRIDLLRGYFVCAMVVDHVCGFSPLWLLTGGNRFFAGAAEGFILVSGLVAGLVYRRLVKRDGLGRCLVKMLSRAFTLYLLTLALTLIFLPLSELLRLPWAQGLDTRDPVTLVVSIITLHRTYYLVDVMLLYTVLFVLAPLALALLDQGRRWWVLGLSWALWGIFQLWPECVALPWPIAGNYLFSFGAWQVIFFTGLTYGYGRKTFPAPRPETARRLLALTGAALLALIGLFFVLERPGAGPAQGLRLVLEELFLDKVAVRPGRLLATGVTFAFLFLLATVYWDQVRRAVGWLLLPLGVHALYAYTAHIGLAALLAIVLAPFDLAQRGSLWLNALAQAASLALIWVLIRHQVLAPTPRTRRFYNLSPALFAALAVIVLYVHPSAGHGGLELASAARPANRFGTPLPPEAAEVVPTPARANRFGTPLPVGAGKVMPAPERADRFGTPLPPRVGEASPTSTPAPSGEELHLLDEEEYNRLPPMERVGPWVGEINGTMEERWFHSAALGINMPYWAYLPPGYDVAGEPYPVLYLLHGAGGHRDEWICFGVAEVADREMSAGALAPMIIIMPQGDRDFWVNSVGEGLRWGDYVREDLIAEVESRFHVRREPAARALGGLSMGGFGALSLGFTYPEAFGVIGAHTPSLHVPHSGVAFLGTGDEFDRRDPVHLAATQPGLEGLRIWLDVGAEDYWLGRVSELHEILLERGIEHEWCVFSGTHEGDYWTNHTIEYLHFYGQALTP